MCWCAHKVCTHVVGRGTSTEFCKFICRNNKMYLLLDHITTTLMTNSDEFKSTAKWPFVYSDAYNVRFGGLEKLHPFDAQKWGNIFAHLKSKIDVNESSVYSPREVTEDELLIAHTKKYLNSLKWGCNVAKIAEIPCMAFVPNVINQKCYLRPMRFQTYGTLLAGKIALERSCAVNIGGGFHHCSGNRGGGFCAYADISLLVKYLFQNYPKRADKVMIVDLDAHQGNGYARDFLDHPNVFILDIYNRHIYPADRTAKKAIRCRVELYPHISDLEYLTHVEHSLDYSLSNFHPDLIVYNAGTDILKGDRLGMLSISPNGVIKRDQMVFMKAREKSVPIVMLTSGGYLKESARIVADSIVNLHDLGLFLKK